MKETRIKVVLRFSSGRCKKRILVTYSIRENRRLPLLFRKAGTIIFQFLDAVYCNNLRTYETHNSQKHTNNPRLHPKIIGF